MKERSRPIKPKRGTAQAAYVDAGGPERRCAPRFEAHFGALIPLEQGQGEIRCRVLDVSDTGALLRLEHALLCPSQFLLKPDLGPQRICAIVWTNGRMLAVRFVEEDAPLLTGCQWATLGAIPQPI